MLGKPLQFPETPICDIVIDKEKSIAIHHHLILPIPCFQTNFKVSKIYFWSQLVKKRPNLVMVYESASSYIYQVQISD